MERPLFPWPTSLTESPTLTELSDFDYPDETDHYLNTTAQPVAASAGPMSYGADILMLQDSNAVGQYTYPGPSNYQPNTWVNQQQPELFSGVFESVVPTRMQDHVDDLTQGLYSSGSDDMIGPSEIDLRCHWPGCTREDPFGRKQELQRHHMSIHIYPGKYQCPHCLRRFNRKDNMSNHNTVAFSPGHTPLQLFLALVAVGGGDPVINPGRVMSRVRTSWLFDEEEEQQSATEPWEYKPW
ncbi:hypothetical protein BO85DRAFT_462742 [Aspergillus piperis CBS 112811]|uniref:C2H2-type domain-containing protein n=1 Tax=Aspergillus piperis CBS 112811 TaxID=1448313 RepID=A0A8G1QYL1_9EURO|nr:hypothetical protein BO85DRAFT_462742 [Aspergillus piperis CBS 112811]RAH53710.1 hypothetical protein BO85DRAFT_462742 [Aspergillus piperis CBS 112811]